jgi:hypothetical protein
VCDVVVFWRCYVGGYKWRMSHRLLQTEQRLDKLGTLHTVMLLHQRATVSDLSCCNCTGAATCCCN